MNIRSFFNSFSFKDIVYICIIGVLGFFGYRIYNNLKDEIQTSRIEYKQLSDSLARAQSELVTKAELKEIAKELGIDISRIKSDLRSLDADLKAVGQTVASIKGKIQTNQGSDSTTPHNIPIQPDKCDLCDIHGYTGALQHKEIYLGDMPYGQVQFDASQTKPWTLKYDDIDIKVNTVIGKQDKEGGHLVFYHTISTVNKSRPDLLDKEFKLKIVSSEFKQTIDTSKEFYLWNPHLDLSISNMLTLTNDLQYSIGADLGLSIMSYGRSKNENDWRFIRLGLGFDNKEHFYLSFTPVQYNIGKHIPLLSDIFIGVSAFYNFPGWGIGITLGTTL